MFQQLRWLQWPRQWGVSRHKVKNYSEYNMGTTWNHEIHIVQRQSYEQGSDLEAEGVCRHDMYLNQRSLVYIQQKNMKNATNRLHITIHERTLSTRHGEPKCLALWQRKIVQNENAFFCNRTNAARWHEYTEGWVALRDLMRSTGKRANKRTNI